MKRPTLDRRVLLTAAYAFSIVLLLAVPATAQNAAGSDAAGSDAAGSDAAGSVVVEDALDVQVLISRQGFSPGVLDGHWGQNTRGALEAWQTSVGLDATGQLDDATRERLVGLGTTPIVEYTITEEDVAGPFVDEIPNDLIEQSKLDSLGYTSVEEMLAERHWTTPETLRSLNPDADFKAGATLQVPNVGERPGAPEGASLDVEVDESLSRLIARAGDSVLFYAPVTSGSDAEPLPIGDWKVVGVSTDPTYSYDPSLFEDAPEDHGKATLAAGPNNPVGVVWIDLDKEHYGLHGTPEPAKIGYTESHGCVRLTNWDAMHLAHMVSPGTEVHFVE